MSPAAQLRAKFFPQGRSIVRAAIPEVRKPPGDWKGRSIAFEEGRRRETMVAAIETALTAPAPLTMLEIAEQVAEQHGLSSWRDLQKRPGSRMRRYVYARQEAMWRIHNETRQSLPAIGRFFGGYDHTTVLHAIRWHEDRRKPQHSQGSGLDEESTITA